MIKSLPIKFHLSFFLLLFIGFKPFTNAQTSPNSIPGLKLWVNGDNVSLSTGNKVDTCFDLSGNGNHLIQSTPSNQPVSVAGGLSSHNTLNFSGSFCYLNFSEISDIRTVFWVIFEDSLASVQLRPLLGHGGSYDFYRGPNEALWDAGFTNSNILNGSTRINFSNVSGTSTSIPKKYSIITLNTTGNVKAENFALDRFVPNRCWAGGLAELIIYNVALSPTEITQVESYLSDKYAPPVNLGADINIPYGFCDTTLVAGNYNQILWSTGETTSSISVSNSGKYWVDVVDVFGRTSTDTILVLYPTFNYPTDTVLCSGVPEVWSSNIQNNNYNFLWSDGSISNNANVISGVPIFCSVTDTNGCFFQSDTLIFSTNNFVSSQLLLNDTLFCGPTYISIIPQVDSIISLAWSISSSSDSILVSSTGPYSVSATNIFGCTSTDSINVQVESPPSFSLGNDTSLCFGVTYQLAPLLLNCTYLWSNNSTNSSLNINQEGLYWLMATNSFGCSSSDTVLVSIDTTFKNSTLGPDVSLCSGNFLSLLNTPSTVSATYLWSDNSSNDSLLLSSSGTYWLDVSNSLGCNFSDTVNVTISGIAPSTFFTFTNSCFGFQSSFLDQTTPPSGTTISSYLWDFGDGTNASSQNPQHQYADTGIFSVNLITTTNVGCSGVYVGNVHVFPNPSANYSTLGSFCNNESVNFNDLSSGNGYLLTSWDWNFGDPSTGSSNSSNFQNTTHLFSNSGLFSVVLTVLNDKGCSDSFTFPLTIKASPLANFNFSNVCSLDSVTFTDNSILPPGVNILSATWDFGGQGISTELAPKFLFSQGGNFPVTYIAGGSNNCFDTITLNVVVKPSPMAAIAFSGVCLKDTIHFIDSTILSSGTISTWNWQLNGQSVSSSANTFAIFNTIDTVLVGLNVLSNLGCIDSVLDTLIIRPLPTADFTYSPSFGSPPLDVAFTNTSSGASNYSWNFGDGFISNTLSPIHQYIDTGLFLVTLNATSIFGCKSQDTASVLVYLPRLDAAAYGASFSDDDGFLKITGIFRNTGTIPITSMDLYARLNDGSYVKETWSGFLPKGALLTYVFNSKLFLKENENYVCLTVLNPNGITDEIPTNNDFCDAYDPEGFLVYDIYPNPAINYLKIPFYLPQRSEVIFTLYDSEGKIVLTPEAGLKEKGFYIYELNTENLALGLYCLILENKTKKIVLKFLRGN